MLIRSFHGWSWLLGILVSVGMYLQTWIVVVVVVVAENFSLYPSAVDVAHLSDVLLPCVSFAPA